MNRADWQITVKCGDCGETCEPLRMFRSAHDDGFADNCFSIYLPARCPKCRSLRAVEAKKS